MLIWGVTAFNHDASIAVIDSAGKLLFASQTERFTRVKNDHTLDYALIAEASKYGIPDKIIYYEDPYLKRWRYLISKQYREIFTKSPIKHLRDKIRSYFIKDIPVEYVEHHESHAGVAYLSPFEEAAVLIIDAIGEFDTISIWKYKNFELEKIKTWVYPNSLGLFYTAFTKFIGLVPNEEEYIMMGMAGYGYPGYKDEILKLFFNSDYSLKYNFHKGLGEFGRNFDGFSINIAASVQKVMELAVLYYANLAKELTKSDNLIYGGGCALNCSINTKLYDIFNNVWIFPNPGDSGSAVGAVGYYLGKKIEFDNMYLGYDIKGSYPIIEILDSLLKTDIAPVAVGRAEFGPRALGNRSIFGNPKNPHISSIINEIKKREKYRPFAPVILEEYFKEYFEVPKQVDHSKYMQFTFKAKYQNLYPGVTHVDGTSRVQTVNEKDNPDLYRLLQEFYARTNCPMLLNTSLNIKSKPIVNNEIDVLNFSRFYNVKVFQGVN